MFIKLRIGIFPIVKLLLSKVFCSFNLILALILKTGVENALYVTRNGAFPSGVIMVAVMYVRSLDLTV